MRAGIKERQGKSRAAKAWVALCSLGVLWLLLTGGCRRDWTLPNAQTTCSPWEKKELGAALDADMKGAATSDERAGWLGCMVLTEGETKTSTRVVRLHKDGQVFRWQGDAFVDDISLPSSGDTKAPFRFQIYGLRYPILDILKQKGSSPSTIRALLRAMETELCPTLVADSYKTCLVDGQMCRFMIEFRPTPPTGTSPPRTLSVATDTVARESAAQDCALYTAAPKKAEVALDAGEPTPDVTQQPESRPEPKPEPRPEPPVDAGPVPLCAQSCLWNRKSTLTMDDGRGRVKGIKRIARSADGKQFVSSYLQFNLRFQGAVSQGLSLYKGTTFHGDFQPIWIHFDPTGNVVARLRKLRRSDGYLLQIAPFERLFEPQPFIDRTTQKSKGIVGGGFTADARAYLVASTNGEISIWRSGGQFRQNSAASETKLTHADRQYQAISMHPKEARWAHAYKDVTSQKIVMQTYELQANNQTKLHEANLPDNVTAFTHHPSDGQIIVAIEEQGLFSYSAELKQEQALTFSLEPKPQKVHKIFFSPDKEVMATLENPVGADVDQRVIRLWRRLPKGNKPFHPYIDFRFFAQRSDGTPRMDTWGDAVFGEDCRSIIVGHNTGRDQLNAWRCE